MRQASSIPWGRAIRRVGVAAAIALALTVGGARALAADTPASESRALGTATREGMGPARDPSPGGTSLGAVRTIVALVAVVGVIAGAAALARRFARRSGGILGALGPGGRAPAGVLEVLGRYPVSRGTLLILFKLDRRILLVSQSTSRRGGGAMATLCEVTDPEEVASILIKTRDETDERVAGRFESLMEEEGRRTRATVGVIPQPRARPRTEATSISGGGIGALRAALSGGNGGGA